VILAGFFCVLGGACATREAAAAVSLDENEEIQWVMGDISALKTAVHAYYGENGQTANAPSLSEILRYFDDGSLPPNAASLYAVRNGAAGWYVGYRAAGLGEETYRLLHENANTLELVCDDLRSPWKRGSAYIWSLALPLRAFGAGAGAPRATIRGGDAIGTAAVMIGTAVLLNIIDDHRHGGYCYRYPKEPWRWRSALVYRHAYRDRFFGRPHRSPPPPHHRPVFRPRSPRAAIAQPRSPHYNRGPSRRDYDVRRPEPRRLEPRQKSGRRPESPPPRRRETHRRGEELRRRD
jgi:hypothetical protein